MPAGFSITFSGEFLEGFDPALVKVRFGERFGVIGPQLDKVFSARRVFLKKGLGEGQASLLRRELHALGLRVDLRDASGAVVILPDDPPEEAVPASAAGPADPTFRILYSGVLLPGFVRARVMADAGRRLKLGERQLQTVFSGREIGLKQGLNVVEVRRYLEVLRDLGMAVRCDPPLPRARQIAPAGPIHDGTVVDAVAEDDLARTVMWSDPVVQERFMDSEDDRLIAALRAEFDAPKEDLPAVRQAAPVIEPTGDRGFGEPHLAQTILNPDALRAFFEPEPDHPAADEASTSPVPEPAVTVMPPEPPPSLAVAEPDHDVAMPERIQLDAGRGERLNGSVVGMAEAIGVPPELDGVMPPPATPSGGSVVVEGRTKPSAIDHTTAILLGVIAALAVILVMVLMT